MSKAFLSLLQTLSFATMVSSEIDETGLIKTGSKKFVTRTKIKWGIFVSFLVVSLVSLIGIIIYTEIYIHQHKVRIDCHPDLPLDYQKCIDRGCLWVQRLGDEPPCFYPNGYGYRSVKMSNDSTGYIVDLKREAPKPMFGHEIDSLKLTVTFETSKRLRIKFVDGNPDHRRYEVPLHSEKTELKVDPPTNLSYSVDFVNDPQFGIRVKRLSTGKTIFDTGVPGMVFSDQFLQITTKLASSYLFGFGERLADKYRVDTNWKRMSFFARDMPPIGNDNIYGVHPFYMNMEDDGSANGLFLLNSNAMEIFVQPYPAVTFRTIGGVLDFYLFLGPTPEEVVQQYLQVIGSPMMPPYWSLGFQLSRYGYKNMTDVQKVVDRTIDHDIPYDVQYLDIDYMESMKTFTIDGKNFGNLKQFTEDLHKKNVRLVLILDPFIASNVTLRESYPALSEGIERNVFITLNGSILEGNCWPGDVYYPDFTYPDTSVYWSELCANFSKEVDFDGLWIDMNEPSNFVEGSLQGCIRNSLNYPPYAAGVLGSKKGGKLFEKTICMDADQYLGKHYDLHSLYGFFESKATFEALKSMGKRPMVLSRSTFSGSGRYAAHWLGDNFATWAQLRASIPGILQFNTFGIPFVGADICGFWENTTQELCSRWMQLGSFYPFSRNHNGIGCNDQDPASLGETVISTSRQALLTRYELLPYLYTLFYQARMEGFTVARPLLHEFPKDRNTWDIDYQFLWGAGLLISPIVHEGARSVSAYFPEGIWYDFYSGVSLKDGVGRRITLQDSGKVNVHVRGGHILPLQTPKKNTVECRKQQMGLFVAPDSNGVARGLLFSDDGESYGTFENKYHLLSFSYDSSKNKSQLLSVPLFNGYPVTSSIGYMTICQHPFLPSLIRVNGVPVGQGTWQYNAEQQVLRLTSLIIPIIDKFKLEITK